MLLSARLDPPDLITASVGGVITPDDQLEVVRFVRAAIATVGSVRVMLVLDRFAGWTADGKADDHALWLRDDEGVSRMAIVGDPEWRVAVLTLLAQPLRRVPIAYFATEAAARRWLQIVRGSPCAMTT
jgi:hypothetical protein